MGDFAYGNSGVWSIAVLAGDDNALKDLDAGFLAFPDLLMDPYCHTGAERRKILGGLACHYALLKLSQ